MAWSYWGLVMGFRDAAVHFSLVSWIGLPLLLHPSLLIVGGRVMQRRDAQDLYRELGLGD